MATLGATLATVTVLYLALCALLWLFEERLLFLPNIPGRELTATPRDLGLAFDEVTITTADGVRLHGWWVPAGNAHLTLLHFHGNAGNIGHRLEMLQIFHDLGVNVLLFDYRGYGQSEGSPGEEGIYRDAEAVWAHLTTAGGLAPHAIVIHGQSMGAAAAAWLAARQQPRGLILESAFTSVPDIAGDVYPWLPGRWLTSLRFNTRSELEQVRCPVLVIHSRDDEIIPFAHGERLFEAAREPRRMLTIAGDHNAGFWISREAYTSGIRDFLASSPQQQR